MPGVNADTPISSADPRALAASNVEPPEPSKPDRMLTETQLREIHRRHPERGELAIRVRRAIVQRFPEQSYSALAGQIHKYIKQSGKPRNRQQIRKRLSERFRDAAGPSDETIFAVLMLTVADDKREATAAAWMELYPLAHPRRADDVPRFVEMVRDPDPYLIRRPAPIAGGPTPPTVPGPGETGDQPGDTPDPGREPDPANGEGPEAQAGDARRIEREQELLDRAGQAEVQLAEARRELEQARELLPTMYRYNRIAPRRRPTDEAIELALTWFAVALGSQIQALEPAADLAHTTDRWKRTAKDKPITVRLPPGGRRLATALLAAAVLGVLAYFLWQLGPLMF